MAEELLAAAVGVVNTDVGEATTTLLPLLQSTTNTLPSLIRLTMHPLTRHRMHLPSRIRLTRNSGHLSMATFRMPQTGTLTVMRPWLPPTTIPATRRRPTLTNTLNSRLMVRLSSTGIPTKPRRSRQPRSIGLTTARPSRVTMPTVEAAEATLIVLRPSLLAVEALFAKDTITSPWSRQEAPLASRIVMILALPNTPLRSIRTPDHRSMHPGMSTRRATMVSIIVEAEVVGIEMEVVDGAAITTITTITMAETRRVSTSGRASRPITGSRWTPHLWVGRRNARRTLWA